MIENEKHGCLSRRMAQVLYAFQKGETIYLGLVRNSDQQPSILATSNPTQLSKPFARVEVVFAVDNLDQDEKVLALLDGIPPYKRMVLLMNNDHLYASDEQLFLRRLRMQILSSKGYKNVKVTKSMRELFRQFPNQYYLFRMIPQAIFGFLDGYL